MKLRIILLSFSLALVTLARAQKDRPQKSIELNFVIENKDNKDVWDPYSNPVFLFLVNTERAAGKLIDDYNKRSQQMKAKGMEFDPDFFTEELKEKSGDVKSFIAEGGRLVINAAIGQVIVYMAGEDINSRKLTGLREDILIKASANVITQVDIKAGRKKSVFVNQDAESFGLDKDFNLGLDIPEQYARDNARVVFQPVVYYKDTQGKELVYCYLRPFVVDGQEYDVTQERRMGYDFKNDPLDNYRRMKLWFGANAVDSTIVMRNLTHTGGYVRERIKKEKVKAKYKADLIRWFEDYNLVYRRDSILGEYAEREPLRFLEYDSLIRNFPIDSERETYKVQAVAEKREQTGNLSLRFKTGKAELEPDDSVGHAQLAQLNADLRKIYNSADEIITAFHIKGQASPDGIFANNQKLGRDRLQYAINQLLSSGALDARLIKTKESAVATWSMVADTLEAMGQMEPAERIRNVVAAHPNSPDAQQSKIRQFADYRTVLLPVAESLRTVAYSYECEVNRPLEPVEVLAKWRTDEDVRSGRISLADYESYYLFDRLDNTDELELVAGRAYRASLNREKRAKARAEANGEQRGLYPWPLAAYHYARCKVLRDQIDTMILKPLLVDSIIGEVCERHPLTSKVTAYRNDPAIVMLQVSMLMKYGDFGRAGHIVQLAGDTTKFKKIQLFLNCLGGGYRTGVASIAKVQEIRDTVAASSMWNRAVLYQAINEPEFDRKALTLMNDTSYFPDQNDLRLLYMKAIVKGRIEFGHMDKPTLAQDVIPKSPELLYCCLEDEAYYRMAMDDADFKRYVRQELQKFWEVIEMRRGDNKAVARADSILDSRYELSEDMVMFETDPSVKAIKKKLLTLIRNRR